MNLKRFFDFDRTETLAGWSLFLFLAGLLLRLIKLGQVPFGVAEAGLAQNALDLSRGLGPSANGNLAYLALTGLSFYILGASDFLARLWPVLAGSSLILLPLVQRKELGGKVAFILTLALAFDPLLVAQSRLIGGSIFVLAGLLWGMSFLYRGRSVEGGLALALALLGGQSFWGALGVLLLMALVMRFVLRPAQVHCGESCPLKRLNLLHLGLTFALGLGLLSTSFFLAPRGLGNTAAGLLEFLQSFTLHDASPWYYPLFLLLAYSGLPLILGIAGMLKGALHAQLKVLLLALGLFLLLSFFAGRANGLYLSFVVLFLWLSGAQFLASLSRPVELPGLAVTALTVFMLVIGLYCGFMLTRMLAGQNWPGNLLPSWVGVLGGLAMLGVVYLLIGLGWSFELSKVAGLRAGLILLLLLSCAALFNGLDVRAEKNALQLNGGVLLLPNREDCQVLAEFDRASAFNLQEVRYSLPNNLDAEFRWFFKHLASPATNDEANADLILQVGEEAPVSSEAYRGMHVVLRRALAWEQCGVQDYLNFALGGRLKTADVKGSLYLKSRYFSGGNE